MSVGSYYSNPYSNPARYPNPEPVSIAFVFSAVSRESWGRLWEYPPNVSVICEWPGCSMFVRAETPWASSSRPRRARIVTDRYCQSSYMD